MCSGFMAHAMFFAKGDIQLISTFYTSRSVDITATKQPRQSDGAKTNPGSIYGAFTHFLFSRLYSCDSPIITPSLSVSFALSESSSP